MPATTKPSFGIDENRLSFGILILLILAGVGYGLWQVVEPLMETRNVETSASRRQIADEQFRDKQYLESADLYAEILKEDPWNGFIVAKLGLAHDYRMGQLVKEAAKISQEDPDESDNDEDGNESEERNERSDADQLKGLEMQIEHHLLKAAAEYEKLEEHARFRSWGSWRLVRLYSIKAKRDDDHSYARKAIEATTRAVEGGYAWHRMFTSSEDVAWLKNFPEYRRLIRKHDLPR